MRVDFVSDKHRPRLGRRQQPPLFTSVARSQIHAVSGRQDIARPGFIIEMQLDAASIELPQHALDSLLDERMIRAVAGDELLDYGSQCYGRQMRVGDVHASSIFDWRRWQFGTSPIERPMQNRRPEVRRARQEPAER